MWNGELSSGWDVPVWKGLKSQPASHWHLNSSRVLWAGAKGLCPCVCRWAGTASLPSIRAKAPAAALHLAAQRSQRETSVSLSPLAPPHFSRGTLATYTLTSCSALRTEHILHAILRTKCQCQKSCCQSKKKKSRFNFSPFFQHLLDAKESWEEHESPQETSRKVLRFFHLADFKAVECYRAEIIFYGRFISSHWYLACLYSLLKYCTYRNSIQPIWLVLEAGDC